MQEALNKSKFVNSYIDIKNVMNPYLYKAGYPVINVTRDYKTGLIKLSQQCLVCDNLSKYKDKDKAKWWIPINFARSSSLNFSSTLPTYWMNPEEKELIIRGVDPDDWIIFNIQRNGIYCCMVIILIPYNYGILFSIYTQKKIYQYNQIVSNSYLDCLIFYYPPN